MTGNKINVIWAPGEDYIIHQGHPESPERMLVFKEIVEHFGFELQSPLPLSRSQIENIQFLGPETEIQNAHQMAAGAVKMACQKLLNGERALVLARPPAHHSPRLSYGTRGFCTINNDAIGIAHLLREKPDLRLAIVDTDAHHGDGNEDFFFYDARIKHFSIHQDGRTIFPGTGFPEVIGAYNNNRNIPLPPGTGDSYLYQALTDLVIPELRAFSPDYVIHVTGFDGHQADYLSALEYSDDAWGMISHLLQPDLTIIEGGYDLKKAIPSSLPPLIKALTEKTYSISPPPHLKKAKNWTGAIRGIWDQSEEELENGKNDPRSRHISFFYDEAFFAEERAETYYPCNRCGGLLHVISSCFSRREFLYMPPEICNRCEEQQGSLQNKKEGDPLIIREAPF